MLSIFNKKNHRVEKIISDLTTEEKIAQLLIVPVWPNKGEKHEKEVSLLLKNYQIGGLIFLAGNPEKQLELTNKFQQNTKIPYLVFLDAEWGLTMRLNNAERFPYQIALGNMPDEKYIYELGFEIARQLKLLGVHVNLAPCIDVNTNPKNPVIGYRSFGNDEKKVSKFATEFMKGLHDNGIISVAKHFPGHGQSDKDSHLKLPEIKLSKKELEKHIYPFRELIKAGVHCIMPGHLYIPALDNSKIAPSSVSKKIITDLLRNELNFKGLIISDAMFMKAVCNYLPAGKIDFEALKAGHDMLEMVENVEKTISTVKSEIEKGNYKISEIDNKLRRVLLLKAHLNLLEKPKIISSENLIEKLNNPKAKKLNRILRERTIKILKNNILPIKKLNEKIACVSIGNSEKTTFQKITGKNLNVNYYNLNENQTENEIKIIKQKISENEIIISGFHNLSVNYTEKFGLTDFVQKIISFIANLKNSVIVLFANPYILEIVKDLNNADAVIITNDGLKNSNDKECELSNEIAAEIVIRKILNR